MNERRLEGRYLCADVVRMDWITNEDEMRSEQAILEDISALGSCVQLEETVPVGATVMLTVGDTLFYGHVCYCTSRDDGYFVGLRFSDETTWSTGVVVPQHLISLKHLGVMPETGD
jgi:hypothetical protein